MRRVNSYLLISLHNFAINLLIFLTLPLFDCINMQFYYEYTNVRRVARPPFFPRGADGVRF